MRALHLLAGLFVVLAAVLWTEPAGAEPYMAVREGYTCGQCHVNHTGGGMRTEFGVVYAHTALPGWQWPITDPEEESRFAKTGLSRAVSVGANLRLDNTTIFAAESTYEGEVVGRIDTQNQFTMPEANLYLKLDVLPGNIALYLDTTLAPYVGTREAFLLVDHLPGGLYVKAGQLLQPFGIRLLDDAAATRVVTGIRYDTPQLGIEAGIDAKPHVISLAVTDNGGGGLGKKVIGSASVTFAPGRIGVSGSWADQSTGDEPVSRWMGGLWGGAAAGRFSLFTELDLVYDTDPAKTQLASIVEGDLLVVRGLNLKVAWDFHDRDLGVREDHRSRVVFGVEGFPVQFLQVSALYDLRLDIPQAPAADRADRLVFQLHGFL